MAVKYIFGILGPAFLVAATWNFVRNRGQSNTQARAWFLIGTIFTSVSAWLWLRA